MSPLLDTTKPSHAIMREATAEIFTLQKNLWSMVCEAGRIVGALSAQAILDGLKSANPLYATGDSLPIRENYAYQGLLLGVFACDTAIGKLDYSIKSLTGVLFDSELALFLDGLGLQDGDIIDKLQPGAQFGKELVDHAGAYHLFEPNDTPELAQEIGIARAAFGCATLLGIKAIEYTLSDSLEYEIYKLLHGDAAA